MGDVAALYDYWRAHPPTHLILQAVYAKEPPRAAVNEADLRGSLRELFSGADAMPAGSLAVEKQMPARLAELADWADEQIAKLKHA